MVHHCQEAAKLLLHKCNGCMLAVGIVAAVARAKKVQEWVKMAQSFDRILRDSTVDGASSCFQLVAVSIYHMLEMGKGTTTGNAALASKRLTAFQALAAFPSSRPLPVTVIYLAYAQLCAGGRCVGLEEFTEVLDYLVSMNLLLVRHRLIHLSRLKSLTGSSSRLL